MAIFNQSLSEADIPQIWRVATIIPLLKAGKPASELASFRPISLTSCVVKLLERMIAERLYHFAETQNKFNHQQAGFRKGRGCEDQIARVVQAIQDGFHHKPMKRSVIALLDFSKAYDMVWRERLLTSMLEQGVPFNLLKWIRSFLQNRTAKVKFNGTLSNGKQMKQGLPQGAVLSPLLFLFYINNLADDLPNTNINSMFADDVAILATKPSLEEAEAAVQEAVTVVAKWAKTWKLRLNAGKSEASHFSTSPREASWTPKVKVEGETIKHEPTPRLLGVILDRTL